MKTAVSIQSWEYDKVFDCDSLIQDIVHSLRMQHLNIETDREQDPDLKQVQGLSFLS